MKKWVQVLLIFVGIPAAASAAWLMLLLLEGLFNGWMAAFLIPIVATVMYILLRKKLSLRFAAQVNAVLLIVMSVCLLAALYIGKGSVKANAFTGFQLIAIPFVLPTMILRFLDFMHGILVGIPLTYAAAMIACIILSRCSKADASERNARPLYQRLLPYLLTGVIALVCGAFAMKLYLNRPEVRYAGHGFDYMHGYSTTDFTDYMVYSKHSKLVTLDHEPEFMIENEAEMPVMDGAEACYPVYAAVAKAVYRDIDFIESEAAQTDNRVNGKIVTFTNTVQGFRRLIGGEVDLLFGARPSNSQFEYADYKEVELTVTPIGREGFVFFVEEDNPVDNLTSEQVRAIYHGEITNWNEVGGKDQEIKAFQRPKDSGSQAMMEYFMGDVTLKDPDTFEVIGGMLDVIEKVAEYANDEGALGYSFRYFIEGLSQEKGVKLLSIDGVAPTLQNIENGSYPLSVDLCLITRKDDSKPNVQKMIDFMLSKDGQEIVRRTGYAGLRFED